MTTSAAPGLVPQVTPSHLIHHVADTDRTIHFYNQIFGAVAEDDMEIESPALDAMFGRSGVRIRSTFINAAGYRLHTIEQLDQPVDPSRRIEAFRGLTGLSFSVSDLEAVRETALAAGFNPTEIYSFDLGPAHSARMFFLSDPDGVGCEMVEYPGGL
jgi:catechol 2,3-dioxygenase-like lactoylglutathione lyase family enzyme